MNTFDLIKIIGSPFVGTERNISSDVLIEVYKKAFADRVALLYLYVNRNLDWSPKLEALYSRLERRRVETLNVITGLAKVLNEFCPDKYSIYKSLKPYPATPNDTDVIIFGDRPQFNAVIEYLYSKGYLFHEWAPMQTTLYDPRGKGKIGKGKKGGTYYIDLYSDISTDYFLYINKKSLLPFIENLPLNGTVIRNVQKEIELAIILFHNVFPERTFQLEHFYMPLYQLKDDNFDIYIMVKFVEEQNLAYAIATNLTIVEYLHNKVFGFVPERLSQLLDKWGRNDFELCRFRDMGENTPYLFSPRTFWITFMQKLKDNAALKSLFVQGLHMLNPVFFMDVMTSLKNRFNEKGTYHLE